MRAQESSGIGGVVVDAANGEPVAGARILLRPTPHQTYTDQAGAFAIAPVAPREYVVVAVAGGFRTVERRVQSGAGRGNPLRIELERLLVEMPGLNVTASGRARAGASAVSVAEIGGEELKRRGVVDLDEALPFAQGVNINAGAIDIRGSSGIARGVGSRVLTLLDGHRTLSGVESSVDFGILPVLDVERIEIVKGPHSTLFGTNAMGGVVNVITRPPLGGAETVAQGYFGAFLVPSHLSFTDSLLSMRGIQVQHSQLIGPAHSTVFVGREVSDGYRQNGFMDRWRVRAKTIFGAESITPLEVFASWKGQDAGEFFTWAASDRPLEVDSAYLGAWKRSTDLIVGATATLLATSTLRTEVRPQLHRVLIENHFDDNNRHQSTRYGTDMRVSLFPGGRHALTIGGEVAHTSVDANFLEPRPSTTDLALFGQDEIELSDRLRLAFGLRADRRSAASVDTDVALSPKVGVSYRAWPRVNLRGSVSRGFRAPSISEQYTSTTYMGFRVVPNLELRGETAWATEVGATATVGDRLWVDAGAFWSEYRGLIEVRPASGRLFAFQFRNLSAARVWGFDAGVRASVVPDRIDMHTTVLLLRSRNADTDEELPYRSPLIVTSTVSGWDGRIAVDFRHRARHAVVLQYLEDVRSAVNLVDLRINARVREMDVQTKLANVLQERYVDVQERYPGATRSLRVTLTSRF